MTPDRARVYCDTCDNSGAYDYGNGLEPCRACQRDRAYDGLVAPLNGSVPKRAERTVESSASIGLALEQSNPMTRLDSVPASGWEPIDLAEAIRRTGPPAPRVLERNDGVCLLYPGRVHAFIGEPESMKSWGWQVAAAQLLGAAEPVMVLDFENDEDAVIERLRALNVSAEEILAGLTYLRPSDAWSPLAEDCLTRLCEARRFCLVVIDGVTDGMATLDLDADRNKDAAIFDRRLVKRFARAGAAVVQTDHVVKDRSGRSRYAIGAQHKLAAIDGATFVFEVVQPFGHGREGLARIKLSKDKPGWLRREASGDVIAELRLSSGPLGEVSGGFEVPEGGTERSFVLREPRMVMEKVSQAIELRPGLTKRAIRESVGGRSNTVDYAIELLLNAGFIRVERGPNRSSLHYLVRRYERHEVSGGEERKS